VRISVSAAYLSAEAVKDHVAAKLALSQLHRELMVLNPVSRAVFGRAWKTPDGASVANTTAIAKNPGLRSTGTQRIGVTVGQTDARYCSRYQY
jgi:hypothetical protein